MPPSVSGSYNYRETIAFSMVEAVQAINPGNVSDKNALVRMLLTGKDSDATEADFRKFMGNTDVYMKSEAKGTVSQMIYNRPKTGRLSGMCYRNAIAEYYETKNPIVIGWEGVLAGDGYLSVMPHAFNYDKKRKCYYDTACNYKKDGRRAVWPLVDGDAALARLQASENFAETWGGFVFILWKGEAYTLRAYGLGGDGTRRVSVQSKVRL